MRRGFWTLGLIGVGLLGYILAPNLSGQAVRSGEEQPSKETAKRESPPPVPPASEKPSDADEIDDPPVPGPGFRPFGRKGGPAPDGPGRGMREEFKLAKEFDKDGDKRLNKDERKAARESIKQNPRRQGRPGGFPGGSRGPEGFLVEFAMKELDADKDAKLTRNEFLAGVERLFSAANADKNDSLTPSELADSFEQLFFGPNDGAADGKRGAGTNRRARPPGKQFPGGFGPGSILSEVIIKRADANNDELVSCDELKSAAERLFDEADKMKSKALDQQGVAAAIATLFPGGPGAGPRRFGRKADEPAKPGAAIRPDDVVPIPDVPLYDEATLRTLFLEFEDPDWEAELADFYHTDVEVPATLIVDGTRYGNVGVHFRGLSSFFAVGPGHKRSLNISLDFVDKNQRLYGYKTLNLLNGHEDPSFMHAVLYSKIARQHIPAPKANFVKLAINGENWGIYINAQQFDKIFISESFPNSKGVRWKVMGSPGGRGGLENLGENVEDYKRHYEMKSDDGDRAWKSLIELCRMLHDAPDEDLEEDLYSVLDVDAVLWFLAVENVLINSDGYWIRASDYSLFRDDSGIFHVIPHDMNESFQPAMGPGGPMRRGGGGGRESRLKLDPLVGMDDETKPLRSRLLSVPAFKQTYLEHVRAIAEEWLDWQRLGPVVNSYRSLIEREVEADTRKLESFEEFQAAVSEIVEAKSDGQDRVPGLRSFAEQRRAYLLQHPAIKALK